MTDIFLSYSSKDREQVRPVRDALSAAGYNVFWDIETPPGANWDQWIRQRMREAKLVIVCWTRSSAESLNVQHEAAIARDSNKLLAVLLEQMEAIDFPMGFYTTQSAQLKGWAGHIDHTGFAHLLSCIQSRLNELPTHNLAARSEDDADTAFLRLQAATGDAAALAELGFRYSRGQGIERDDARAVALFRLAADAGNSRGRYNLGAMHFEGRGGLAVDHNEAVRLWSLAARDGNPHAHYNLGNAYVSRQEFDAAISHYRAAADMMHPEGQFRLAVMYENGQGVARDETEAARLYTLASDKGVAEAHVRLAAMHLEGRGGLTVNPAIASKLLSLGAEKLDHKHFLQRVNSWLKQNF